TLVELADRARAAKKSLLIGIVDEESDLTYYRIRRPSPHGAVGASPLREPAPADLVHDRVVVHAPDAVEALGGSPGFGSRLGRRLELSLIEAAYLVRLGQITLRSAATGRPVPLPSLERRAGRLDPAYPARAATYRDLRERGMVVKTGFKYGAHFRAYPRNPEHTHARYLVHAAPEGLIGPWPEVSGSVRVAQGVRKELLLAAVPEGSERPVRYLELERVRP
ncbi:MAG: tRNA-intron lyase, partial [Thermoplasmata archaeon]